jgi:hypothetical protein
MTDIYEQHEKAFARVSAFVILRNGERVATIAFKFPADGAGRLYAYVHWLGVPMVRGGASGYGYDKRSAACFNALAKANLPAAIKAKAAECKIAATDGRPWHDHVDAFNAAILTDDGQYWDRRLEKAGFTVLQAV